MKINHQDLHPDTLRNLLESFILEEGTDYGHAELSLTTKRERLEQLLIKGKAHIVYDPATETCHIKTTHQL